MPGPPEAVPGAPLTVIDARPIIYFVSDVHLGASPPPEEAVKRERLLALFNRVEREAASLYILGDLFDFWFSYRTVIPRTAFGLLSRLAALAEGGLPVRYLGGNHDFWLCDFLRRETRIEVLTDGTRLDAQGRHIRLVHGDGVGPGDYGYKTLKKIFRNPLVIGAFRWIHPDLGIPLGLGSSDVSRKHTAEKPVDVETLFATVALPMFRSGDDALLMGHHHVPVHLARDGGDFLILGDWFRHYTCARLTQGQFQLLTWPLDAGPTPESPTKAQDK